MDETMKNLLVLFIILIFIKFLINSYNFLKIRFFQKKYIDYVQEKIEPKDINENIGEIKDLLKKAGIEEPFISRFQLKGFGYLEKRDFPIIENIQVHDKEVYVHITGMFEKASGIFKKNMFDSFNPFYWLETIVFLPRTFFSYLGIGKDKVIVKSFQILWWILASAISFFYAIYKPEIDNMIKSTIQSTIK